MSVDLVARIALWFVVFGAAGYLLSLYERNR
jgi:hypothetical protein